MDFQFTSFYLKEACYDNKIVCKNTLHLCILERIAMKIHHNRIENPLNMENMVTSLTNSSLCLLFVSIQLYLTEFDAITAISVWIASWISLEPMTARQRHLTIALISMRRRRMNLPSYSESVQLEWPKMMAEQHLQCIKMIQISASFEYFPLSWSWTNDFHTESHNQTHDKSNSYPKMFPVQTGTMAPQWLAQLS